MNQDRLAKVRANLRNQGLEQALLVDPLSIWWLCGYYTEPYERFLALYVPAEGTPTLFLNRLFPEAGGACEDVRTFSDTDDPVAWWPRSPTTQSRSAWTRSLRPAGSCPSWTPAAPRRLAWPAPP